MEDKSFGKGEFVPEYTKKEKLVKFFILTIGILIIPVIYCATYVSSVWNVYDNTGNMPIAVVNEDKGTTYEGSYVNYGSDLVDELKKNDKMDWEFVDRKTADEGVQDSREGYYAIVEIPEDFSRKMVSVSTTDKEQPYLVYAPNQTKNYIAGLMANSAMNTLKLQLNAKEAEKVADALVDKLSSVPDQLQTANDGVGQLRTGSESLKDGFTQLKSGNDQITSGLETLSTGARSMQSGIGRVSDGLNTFKGTVTAGINQARAGMPEKLSAGVGQAMDTLYNGADGKSGINAYTNGVDQLADGVTSYTGNVDALISQVLNGDLTSAQTQATIKAIAQGINDSGASATLSGSAKALKNSSNSVRAGKDVVQQGLVNGLSQSIDSSLNTLSDGISSGVDQLSNGVSALSGGATEISGGADRLLAGSRSLGTGLNSASGGASQIADGLVTLNDKFTSTIEDSRAELVKTDGMGQAVADGVEVETQNINPVDAYGISFAPYFLNISSWVGGLVILMVLYYDYDRTIKTLGPSSKRVVLRFVAFVALAAAQAVLCGLVMQFAVGVPVSMPFEYYLGLIEIAVTYTIIIEFLMVMLGSAGRLLSIIIMVLQLTSTGGTFPIQLNPPFFQALNPFMPMTYGIQLMKETITGSSASYAYYNMGMVFIFALIFLGGLMVGNLIKHHIRIKKEKKGNLKLSDAFRN